MTERLVRPALVAILGAVAGIEAAIRDMTFEAYFDSWIVRRAVERGIEIISEASRRIPAELRDTQPQVPWPRVIAIGNVLRHEYHDISDAAIWSVVQHDLPVLKHAVTSIERDLQEGP